MANVLIVDDSLIMRRSLGQIIKRAGHTVISEASNGIEAIEEYAKHNPDLVTMDISMPCMDGLESLKSIMSEHPQANIIIISAYSQKDMVLDAIENGAKSYILKPVSERKVNEIVRKILDTQ